MNDDVERKERQARKDGIFFAAFAALAFPVVLSIAFLALHLPYLPASLEDLDSINFAFGLRHFDVARHNPHPPGYPVFIVLGKAVRAVVPAEATALGLLSVLAGTLGVLAIAALFRRMEEDDDDAAGPWPLAATALAMTSPLYWFTAARPLSDMAGLAGALAVQVVTVSTSSARVLAFAAFGAGLATGLRSQVAWLTLPLLIVRGLEIGGWRSGRGLLSVPRPLTSILIAFAAGALVWAVPLVAITGGPAAYWNALANQGAEDLGNIQMLWTHHDGRAILDALYYAFAAPWANAVLAVIVLLLCAAGVVRTARRAPRALVWLAAGFGPYLLFDLLFQETFTSRYALPLVIPMAYLAVAGARLLPRRSGLLLAIPLAMFCAHVGGTSIAAYSREKAPAFRLFDDMRRSMNSAQDRPVIAMDRRESLDLRKPLAWDGGLPDDVRMLSAPPQHEWLEAVKYWNSGGRAPAWFVVDPMRTSIDLVQHGSPVEYRWPLPYPVLLGGVRPGEMDWYRVDRPEWYVGEGWSLTPESAGVAEADRQGLAYGPIAAWLNTGTLGGALMIGGRNLEPTVRPRLAVKIAGVLDAEFDLPPGPFSRVVSLPFVAGDRAVQYVPIAIAATPPSHVAIEQFDASATRPVFAFGEGWHEQEFNPATGLRWRWLSERGELNVAPRATRRLQQIEGESPLLLHLEGESPRRNFARGSRLVIRSGAQVVFDRVLTEEFSLDVPLVAAQTVVLETDQVFSPADRSGRSADRRHLGLRLYKCEVRVLSR